MSMRREAVASRVTGSIPGYSMAAAPGRRAVAKSVRVRKKEREQVNIFFIGIMHIPCYNIRKDPAWGDSVIVIPLEIKLYHFMTTDAMGVGDNGRKKSENFYL
jgi:hypothetical protein